MLIKPVDDLAPHIEVLQHLLERANDEQARQIRARILALEGRLAAAAELDRQLADSDQAVVIHDLRLEMQGTSTHFDHVVINRRMEAFVLDSRFFNTGVRVEAEERFFHVDEVVGGAPLEIIDPLNDLAERVHALANAVLYLSWPHRLGVRLIPQVHGRIVVGPDAHVHLAGEHNPGGQVTWLEDVLEHGLRGKPGQGGGRLAMLRAMASTVTLGTLQGCAEALAGRHVARAPDDQAEFDISDQPPSPGDAPEQTAQDEDTDTPPPDESQASEKKLPSSRIASALGMKTGPLLDLLAEQGLLEQQDGAWQLTEKGIERGGEQRGSGKRISFAWPASVKEEARAARDQS